MHLRTSGRVCRITLQCYDWASIKVGDFRQHGSDSAFEMRLVERVDNPKVLAAAEAAWMEKLGARQAGVGFNAGPAGTGLWYATSGLAVPGQLELAHDALSLDGLLALELINTEMMERGKRHDVLTSPDKLARWWAEVCELYPEQCAVEGALAPTAWTSEMLDAVKALRMALRRLITRVVEQHAVEEENLQPLNEVLALGYSALERTGQGHVKTVMHLRDPQQGRLLFSIAVSALRLFTETDWERLHQCRSDRCILFFYDTTKSATRRWCSPDCMNRARSIQHYHLAKKKAAPA